MANPRPKSLDEESPFKTNVKPEDKKDEKKPLAEDALKTYGLGPYSASTLKAENKIKEMTKKMEDMCGIKEYDTCLGVPSQWDLVPDKQVMKEEQPFVGCSEYDTHGTTILCVLCDEKDLMCTCDGRTSNNLENRRYVKNDTGTKFYSMGDDYVACASGKYYYSTVALRKIHEQFIHPKKPNKEEMKDAIKKVKEEYVENWTKEDSDPNTYDNDIYHGKFPSTVCLYGLDDSHVITTFPEDVTVKELTVNGTQYKISFQGSGGIFAYNHFLKVIGRAKSKIDVLECMRESVAMACLKDGGSGGFIPYVLFPRGGRIKFSHEEEGEGHHHHVFKVVSNHFETMEEYTSNMLLVLRRGLYTADPKSEVEFEKRLLRRFSGAYISVLGVQIEKQVTVRKFWCESANTLADAYVSINDGEFDRAETAGGELERQVFCVVATKGVFEALAKDFEDMKECL